MEDIEYFKGYFQTDGPPSFLPELHHVCVHEVGYRAPTAVTTQATSH